MSDEKAGTVVSLVTKRHREELSSRARTAKLADLFASEKMDSIEDFILVTRDVNGVVRIDCSDNTRLVVGVGMIEMAKSLMLSATTVTASKDDPAT